ncbi:unnamed protein product [Pedinophyceae sp. YPF-701]|nr:unnamed protein product [Pedinophyceae sp. YPF-701]
MRQRAFPCCLIVLVIIASCSRLSGTESVAGPSSGAPHEHQRSPLCRCEPWRPPAGALDACVHRRRISQTYSTDIAKNVAGTSSRYDEAVDALRRGDVEGSDSVLSSILAATSPESASTRLQYRRSPSAGKSEDHGDACALRAACQLRISAGLLRAKVAAARCDLAASDALIRQTSYDLHRPLSDLLDTARRRDRDSLDDCSRTCLVGPAAAQSCAVLVGASAASSVAKHVAYVQEVGAVFTHYARAAEENRNSARAHALLDAVLAHCFLSEPMLLTRARAALDIGALSVVRANVARALTLSTASPDALNIMAEALLRLGQSDAALSGAMALLRGCLHANPGHAGCTRWYRAALPIETAWEAYQSAAKDAEASEYMGIPWTDNLVAAADAVTQLRQLDTARWMAPHWGPVLCRVLAMRALLAATEHASHAAGHDRPHAEIGVPVEPQEAAEWAREATNPCVAAVWAALGGRDGLAKGGGESAGGECGSDGEGCEGADVGSGAGAAAAAALVGRAATRAILGHAYHARSDLELALEVYELEYYTSPERCGPLGEPERRPHELCGPWGAARLRDALEGFLGLTQAGEHEPTFLEVLGLTGDEARREDFRPKLKRAYRRKALEFHPDKGHEDPELAEDMFVRVTEANEVLGDEEKRREYLASLEDGGEDDGHDMFVNAQAEAMREGLRRETMEAAQSSEDDVSNWAFYYERRDVDADGGVWGYRVDPNDPSQMHARHYKTAPQQPPPEGPAPNDPCARRHRCITDGVRNKGAAPDDLGRGPLRRRTLRGEAWVRGRAQSDLSWHVGGHAAAEDAPLSAALIVNHHNILRLDVDFRSPQDQTQSSGQRLRESGAGGAEASRRGAGAYLEVSLGGGAIAAKYVIMRGDMLVYETRGLGATFECDPDLAPPSPNLGDAAGAGFLAAGWRICGRIPAAYAPTEPVQGAVRQPRLHPPPSALFEPPARRNRTDQERVDGADAQGASDEEQRTDERVEVMAAATEPRVAVDVVLEDGRSLVEMIGAGVGDEQGGSGRREVPTGNGWTRRIVPLPAEFAGGRIASLGIACYYPGYDMQAGGAPFDVGWLVRAGLFDVHIVRASGARAFTLVGRAPERLEGAQDLTVDPAARGSAL